MKSTSNDRPLSRRSTRPTSVYLSDRELIQECKQSLDELIKASQWLQEPHEDSKKYVNLHATKHHLQIPNTNYTKLVVSLDKPNINHDYCKNDDCLFKDDQDIIKLHTNTFKSSLEFKLKKSTIYETNNCNNNHTKKEQNVLNNKKNSIKFVQTQQYELEPSHTRPLLCLKNDCRPISTDCSILQGNVNENCSGTTLKIDSLDHSPLNIRKKSIEPSRSRNISPLPPIKVLNKIPNSDSMSSFKTNTSLKSNCTTSTTTSAIAKNQTNKSLSKEKSPKRQHRNHSWIASSLRKAFGIKRDDSKRRFSSEEEGLRHSKSSSLRRELSPNTLIKDEAKKRLNYRLSGSHHNYKRNFRSESELLDDEQVIDSLPPKCINQEQTHRIQRGSSVANMHSRLNLNDILVSELRYKLSDVESKLTDCRLEALSSVNYVDQLKDFVDKLSLEMLSLKCENHMLKNHLHETKTKQNQIDSLKDLSDIYEESLEDLVANRKFEGFVKSLSQINDNIFNYHASYDFLLNDDGCSNTHRALVVIKCSYFDSSIELIQSETSDICLHAISWIQVDSKLRWKLMDGIVKYLVKRFLYIIDPSNYLGLSSESIAYYNIGEIKRVLDDINTPDLLPFGYLVGDKCRIEITFKYEDFLSFDTLLPKHLLNEYLKLLSQHRFVAISGSNKYGKTYLMRHLARYMAKKNDNEVEYIYYDMDKLGSSSEDNTHVKSVLITNLNEKITCFNCDSNKKKPILIMIDNLHEIFREYQTSIDVLLSLIKLKSIENIYFIATFLDATKMYNIDDLLIQVEFNKNFKRIILSPTNEPLKHFLERFLFKRLVHYRTTMKKECKTNDSFIYLEKIIVWLIDVYRLCNNFIEKYELHHHYLSPFIFIDFPLNAEDSEKWFIQLWNYTLVPYLNDFLRIKSLNHDEFNKRDDLTEGIIRKYPWINQQNKQMLHKLNTHKHPNFNDNFESNLNMNLQNSNQRFIKMLDQLHKTTLKSKMNRNDISSEFFESLSPMSNTSDLSMESHTPSLSKLPRSHSANNESSL